MVPHALHHSHTLTTMVPHTLHHFHTLATMVPHALQADLLEEMSQTSASEERSRAVERAPSRRRETIRGGSACAAESAGKGANSKDALAKTRFKVQANTVLTGRTSLASHRPVCSHLDQIHTHQACC